MTADACAFLSYTRLDDEFFGGAITSLRSSLELGVKVVTGNKNFSIFQDQEGIELGQRWQLRLDQEIEAATFFIPILTPSFFNSKACRNELQKFLDHEKRIGRTDLMLPIYFVTSPQLERSELQESDFLVAEVGSRQRFDWRDRADTPTSDPNIRRAIMKLANAVSEAIERVNENHINQMRSEMSVAANGFSTARKQKKSENRPTLLWVDDRPQNNVFERNAFSEYNIDVRLALSTEEALDLLKAFSFDVIISDMGRPFDDRAGYTLLSQIRSQKIKTPFFIYAGSRLPEHSQEARSRGAQGNTNRADELIEMVLRSVGRNDSDKS